MKTGTIMIIIYLITIGGSISGFFFKNNYLLLSIPIGILFNWSILIYQTVTINNKINNLIEHYKEKIEK